MTDPRTDKRLLEVKRRLLFNRRWSYLRYLHLKEGFVLAPGAQSVLCVGAGRGIAKVGLAVEFPDTHFFYNRYPLPDKPNYSQAKELVSAWELENVTFGVLDILAPQPDLKFDLVCSVEVLEHIDDDLQAIRNMFTLSKEYVFALVPSADKNSQQDPASMQRAWDRHEHFRVGYDADDLALRFSNRVELRGCYWSNAGQAFRSNLQSADIETVLTHVDEWAGTAQEDIQLRTPQSSSEAQGIWVLAAKHPGGC